MILAVVDPVSSWALSNWLTITVVYLAVLLVAYVIAGPRNLKEWQELGALCYGGLAGLSACFATGSILFFLMFQTPLFSRWWGDSTLAGIALQLVVLLVGVALHFAVIAVAVFVGIRTFNYVYHYIIEQAKMHTATAVLGTAFGTTTGVVVALVALLFAAYVAVIIIAFIAAAVAIFYGFIMLLMILAGAYITSD